MGATLRKKTFLIETLKHWHALFSPRAVSHVCSSNEVCSPYISSQRILNNLVLRGLDLIWFTSLLQRHAVKVFRFAYTVKLIPVGGPCCDWFIHIAIQGDLDPAIFNAIASNILKLLRFKFVRWALLNCGFWLCSTVTMATKLFILGNNANYGNQVV
jgi:hypothetical protein